MALDPRLIRAVRVVLQRMKMKMWQRINVGNEEADIIETNNSEVYGDHEDNEEYISEENAKKEKPSKRQRRKKTLTFFMNHGGKHQENLGILAEASLQASQTP